MNVIRQIMFFYDYVRPVLDVLILAYILYKVFDILVKNQALQLLKGGAILLSMYGLALFFKLRGQPPRAHTQFRNGNAGRIVYVHRRGSQAAQLTR